MRCCVTALVAVAACALVPPSLSTAAEVDFVAVTAGSYREDTVTQEYFLSFSLEGFEIAAVDVLKPGAPPTLVCSMVQEGDNDWNCDLGGFASLNDICLTVGFGDFLFEVTASVGSDDSVTLSFDPGCTDPIAAHADITAPTSGGTVPPTPGPSDFCWDCSVPGGCGNGDTAASIFNADADVAVEVLRGALPPACWDPGVCLPVGTGYEFEVSVLDIEADFEPRLTDLGDDFVYASAFESVNLTFFGVAGSVPTTPPAAPAGSGATEALLAGKLDPAGASIDLSWDVDSCCAVVDHHLVYGTGADLPGIAGGAFALDGSVCSLGATGSFTWSGVPDPGAADMLWWLVLANDGVVTEGSWGLDGNAAERAGPGPGGASGQCGKTVLNVANACGR